MKTVVCALLLAVSVDAASEACQPCAATLDMDDSIMQADVVIAGRRLDYDPQEQAMRPGGPDTVTVSILRVFKGSVAEPTILVNSWDGMCPYGIVVDDQPYVMILKRRENLYDPVNLGCAVITLRVVGDIVEIAGEWMSLDEFGERIASGRITEKEEF